MKKIEKSLIISGLKLLDDDSKNKLKDDLNLMIQSIDGIIDDAPTCIIEEVPLVGNVQFFIKNDEMVTLVDKSLYKIKLSEF